MTLQEEPARSLLRTALHCHDLKPHRCAAAGAGCGCRALPAPVPQCTGCPGGRRAADRASHVQLCSMLGGWHCTVAAPAYGPPALHTSHESLVAWPCAGSMHWTNMYI